MLDLVFRPQCAACGVPADTLCEDCACTLLELGTACEKCAEPIGAGLRCARCAVAPLPIDRIVSAWRFGGQLAIAIRRLKFAGKTHVARAVAPLWSPLVAAAAAAGSIGSGAAGRGADHALVVPVPLHWRRRFMRGFDQARRRDNLRDAFAVRLPVAGRSVVLVDDVVTTGATIASAARALFAAGATSVVGVALARATSFP